MVEIPKSGNNNKGIKATAGIGMASVIHQIIIRAATAITLDAFISSPKGLNNKATNNSGAIQNLIKRVNMGKEKNI